MDLNVSFLLNKILSTEVLKTLLICVSLLVLHVLFLFGFVHSLLLIISYAIGFYVFHFLIHYVGNVDDILSFLTNIILEKCWPHHSSNHVDEPKKNDELLVPKDIDSALDQFMDRVVNHYLTHWYANISADANFPYEIRTTIQKAVAVCYRRFSKVKREEFIYKKVLPVILNHLQVFKELKHNTNIPQLHIAVHSRTAELMYIQNVSKCLIKYVLPESEVRCKSFSLLLREILTRSVFLALSDTLCNPDHLNPLLLHYLKGYYNFMSTDDNNDVDKVQLLDGFVSALKIRPVHSCLRPDLAVIFKDSDLKEAFMRYLKMQNIDYMLQFCIDIELFKNKLSKQNLEAEDLDNLYRDAWDLYSVYFSSYSPNCIKFEEDYASILRKALSKDILKLESSNTISDAYNYVYTQLETYCYDFYGSNEFYFWLYGRCEATDLRSNETLQMDNVSIDNGCSRKTTFELSNKLNIIKDVLKPNQILEGQMQDIPETESSTELGEDAEMAVSSNERNLNTWKVYIPAVGSRLDPITNKPYTVFVLQVQSEEGKEWLVERRPNDFYSLDVKLTEFHGSFPDAQLPPRRLMTSRAESIQQYEEYLNKLIKNPALKSSELLSTFLSSMEDFEEEETSLGKLFRKSVVPTLRKERGQNLEVFINSFVSSCRMTSRYEWKDIGDKKYTRKPASYASKIYENNFDVGPDMSQQIFYTHSPWPPNDEIFSKPSTSVLYLGVRLYNIQDKVVKLLLTLQSCFGGVFDQLIVYFLKRSFSRILTTSNIAYIINLIEKLVFDGKSERSQSEDIQHGLTEVLDSLKDDWLHPLYVTVYENLQNAKLNKQLYYQLMDVTLQELFPELNQTIRV